MAIDTTPSQVATSALAAIPFGSIIGGPLKACIEAQAMAAKTSWNFIQDVGLNIDPKTGEKSAVNVSFQFMKDGRMAQLNVPLLTIVPIPYIAIQSIDINFKANISASSSSTTMQSDSTAIDAGVSGTASLNMGIFKLDASFNASYSSKKDSKATQDSKYSVEYTMDVAVKAGQDSMPAGLAKVLELLGNSMDVSDPSGTLEVNALEFKGAPSDTPMLIVTYKNRDGLFEPDKIQIAGQTGKIDGDNKIFNLPIVEGKESPYVVSVSGVSKRVVVKTIDVFTDQQKRRLAQLDRENESAKRLSDMEQSIKDAHKTRDDARAEQLKRDQAAQEKMAKETQEAADKKQAEKEKKAEEAKSGDLKPSVK